MNIEKARKMVFTDMAKKSNDLRRKKYGKDYPKLMAHIRKGKKIADFKTS